MPGQFDNTFSDRIGNIVCPTAAGNDVCTELFRFIKKLVLIVTHHFLYFITPCNPMGYLVKPVMENGQGGVKKYDLHRKENVKNEGVTEFNPRDE